MTARQEAIASAVAAHSWVGPPMNRCLCGHAPRHDYYAARKEHEAHLTAAIAAAVDAAVEAERAEDRARLAADSLYEARDALYRGEGPDMFQDADLVYGEWLGNRAAALAPPPTTRPPAPDQLTPPAAGKGHGRTHNSLRKENDSE